MKRKLFPFFILSIFFLLFLYGCNRPTPTGADLDKIDTSQDPIQTSCASNDPIAIEIKNGQFTITPLSEYKLSGLVVSKETYSSGWAGEISPIDLAIVWGKLAEPEYEKYIKYSQSNRWYFYKYKPEIPSDNSYIISHSANNHIIPANENVRRAVMMIKKKDKVVLEGLLVNLKGTYKGGAATWNSSLSRTDTGDGSCELFYVNKVRIDTLVYE
jgi:hypothetical protein